MSPPPKPCYTLSLLCLGFCQKYTPFCSLTLHTSRFVFAFVLHIHHACCYTLPLPHLILGTNIMHFTKQHFLAADTSHLFLNTVTNDTKRCRLQHKTLFAVIFPMFLLVGVDVVSSGSETDNAVQVEYFLLNNSETRL
jgi:hypothetical protein